MLLKTFFKIDHELVIFSVSSVYKIYFELASISKNQNSNSWGFTVVSACSKRKEWADRIFKI